jgi:hypothetical protein
LPLGCIFSHTDYIIEAAGSNDGTLQLFLGAVHPGMYLQAPVVEVEPGIDPGCPSHRERPRREQGRQNGRT